MTRSSLSPHDPSDQDGPGAVTDEDVAPVRPDADGSVRHGLDADHSYSWDVVEEPATPDGDGALAARAEHPATPAAQSAGEDGTTGEDWAGTPVAASSMTPYDPTPPGAGSGARRRAKPWIIAGIGLLLVVLLLGGCTALTIGGLRVLTGLEASDPGFDDPGDTMGWGTSTVLDADGKDVTGTVGSYDEPALVGEHTVLAPTFSDGEISVRPTEIDLDATLPHADGADVIDPAYRLVVLTTTVTNNGSEALLLTDEMTLDASTDLGYYVDVAAGLVPEPLTAAAEIPAGGEVELHSAFLVPEDEVDSLQILVQPYSADSVTFEAP